MRFGCASTIARCKVRQHRSPDACPYRGRQSKPVRWNPPIPRPTPTGTSQLSKPLDSGQPTWAGGRYRQTAVANGITFVDLLVLLLVSQSWERFYPAISWWGVALVVILVVLPFAFAGWLTRTCAAWNSVARGCGRSCSSDAKKQLIRTLTSSSRCRSSVLQCAY